MKPCHEVPTLTVAGAQVFAADPAWRCAHYPGRQGTAPPASCLRHHGLSSILFVNLLCIPLNHSIIFKYILLLISIQNYGDEGDASGLLNPSTFAQHGVHARDFLCPRSQAEVPLAVYCSEGLVHFGNIQTYLPEALCFFHFISIYLCNIFFFFLLLVSFVRH